MKYVFPCLTSFMLVVIIMPFVIRMAIACKCLDIPGERHLHKKTTPRWGGVAFFIGVLPFMFFENGSGIPASYIVASLLLVCMGVIDDLKPLGWKIKFAVIAAAATIVIFGGKITVLHIGVYGGPGPVELGLASIPFTYLSIIGITNAINLLDGLDGLAGGVSLLGFLFLGIAALLAGNITVAVICFAFVGALGAFLLYNFPNAKIFMGDSGSLFLGFSLSITSLLLTQDAKSSVEPMFPVLVLLIPIFDTLRVLLVRVLNGSNPFQADNLHLHYLMTQTNISPVKVTLLIWLLTAIFGATALSLIYGTSVPYLNAMLLAASLLSLFIFGLSHRRQTTGEAHCKASSVAGMRTYRIFSARHTNFSRKGETMTIKWMVILGVVLLATQAFAAETALLKTEKDRVNYAIGVNMIGNFKQQGIEIDLELMVRGMKDALSGGPLLMSDGDLRKSVSLYMAAARQKQAKLRINAAEENKNRGAAFLADNSKKEGVTTLPSGLQYMVIKAGNGKKPADGDIVVCNYTGTLINGTVFDRSPSDKPATFKVSGGIIAGWSEALKLMPAGSKWRLFIPSRLAYGAQGRGRDIGPNETLIFEVELLAIK